MTRSGVVAPAVIVSWLALAGSASVSAQAPADETALAKTSQNPVGALVSLPLQFNFNTGGALGDETFFNLNFQPVIPVRLPGRYIVIARTIVPYFSLPAGAGTRQSGIGDIQEQLFVTPSHPGGIIWGLGPILSFPTASNSAVKTGSWAIGPTALLLKMSGPWVLGTLMNQLWNFADDGGDPEVNQFLIQPFANYNFGKGWALSSSLSMTANWNAPSGDEWTVPLGMGISKTTQFNGRPITVGAQYYHNVERPAGSAADQLRINLTLLYPPRPKPAAKPQ
jgi:hypothetical protein